MPAPTADKKFLTQAHQAKQDLLRQMFGFPAYGVSGAGPVLPPTGNVLGVGYGAKVTAGAAVANELAIRVYVRAKLPESALGADEKVPAFVNKTPTDVIPVGDVIAFPRPTDCGVSVGHLKITAGTLGCLVRKNNVSSGDRYVLSNNHILANCNSCAAGDEVWEPGPSDGGTTAIAKLTEWEPLVFGAGGKNTMDAAIARVLNLPDVNPNILTIGRVVPPVMLPSLYQSVRKHGRTTLHTVGVIMDLSADLWVAYGTQKAWFEDQIAVVGAGGPFSAGGDSGSLIVDAVTCRPVALLFAGGLGQTFANPIDPVLARFTVEIL